MSRIPNAVFAFVAVAALLRGPDVMATEPVYSFKLLAGSTGNFGSTDGVGAAARFNSPTAVAVDGARNVYVADAMNRTIRKVTPAGVVSTLAGLAGAAGTADGVGGAARFDYPVGITADENGNLYVVEGNNHTVRKISTSGLVTTIAGRAGQSGSIDGEAAAATFNSPRGIGVDRLGNIYVADRGNHSIRKITAAGMVQTVAGLSGTAGDADGPGVSARFTDPTGLAIDPAGNVYVGDQGNHKIRKITPQGDVTALAGSGSNGFSPGADGAMASFGVLQGIAIDGGGNVYVVDSLFAGVQKISPAGHVTVVAGGEPQAGSSDGDRYSARFNSPDGIAADAAGYLYVADTANNTIRKIAALSGDVTTLAGRAETFGSVDGVGSAAEFSSPVGVATDASGNAYVADTGNHVIRKISPGGEVTTWAGAAGQPGAADGPGATARFSSPWALAIDGRGAVYVADTGNYTVRKVTPQRVVSTIAGSPGLRGTADGNGSAARFQFLRGLAVDKEGNLYATDDVAIRKISANGEVVTWAGGHFGGTDGVGTAAEFSLLFGITVDRAGYVYVVDSFYSTIRKITPSGAVTTVAGSPSEYWGSVDGRGAFARFAWPKGIAMDPDGNLYVTDTMNNVIRRISPEGQVTTIGGVPGQRGTADGGAADARFNDPIGIAVTASGVLYVADTGNNSIRKGFVDEGLSVPWFTARPQDRASTVGGTVELVVTATGSPLPTIQWQWNGNSLAGRTEPNLALSNVQPAHAGLYSAVARNSAASVAAPPAIVGIVSTRKVIGAGEELLPTDIPHPNGNVFDQVLLKGAAEAITADYDPDPAKNQITRTSFEDIDGDIVQVEFSGPGTLSLVLDMPRGPAAPLSYNQATNYMSGRAGIVIAEATEQTNVSVFSVGKATAVNQALFKDGVKYDGIADIAFIAILSSNGKFGGVWTANANYSAAKGYTGLYAPGVTFKGPVFIGNIRAFDAATPVIQVGAVSDARITGGDLAQANGAAVQVSGLTQLKFTAGGDSHGNALPAQKNKAVLTQDGVDVTAQIVVNP